MSHSHLQSHSYITGPDSQGPSMQAFTGPDSPGPSMQAFSTSDSRPGVLGGRHNAVKNREKQLEALKKFEERLRESLARQSGTQGQNQ